MLLIIILILVALVLLAILSSIGRRKTEERASRVAAANHERIRRETPNSTYASMGSNEFLEEYNRFLMRRGFKILGIFVAAFLLVPAVLFAMAPVSVPSGFVFVLIVWPFIAATIYVIATGGRFPKWPQK